MYISIDREQAEVLREILQTTLKQLRVEEARADSHDYREWLHTRDRVIEQLILKLSEESRAAIT